jgi:hypothetical protein
LGRQTLSLPSTSQRKHRQLVMIGTITTRAGESQRAHDGLHSFSEGPQGANAIDGLLPTSGRSAERSRLPADRDVRATGNAFLASIFARRGTVPDSVQGILLSPTDRKWLLNRIKRLRPMSDGPLRIINKDVWNLATALMQRGRDYIDVWKYFAERCPRDWLADFSGVAMLTSDGEMRSLDNRRAQAMLALGLILWFLAEHDPDGDNTGGHYPYVIRGLPYGAFMHLLAYYEEFADGAKLKAPGRNTIWGTHEVGGRFDRGSNGYLAAFKQAGLIKTAQPNGWTTPPGMRGKPRKNERGEWECWAYVQIRLRIRAPGLQPALMGPPPYPIWLRCPPPREPVPKRSPPKYAAIEQPPTSSYMVPEAIASSEHEDLVRATTPPPAALAGELSAVMDVVRGLPRGSSKAICAEDDETPTFDDDPNAVTLEDLADTLATDPFLSLFRERTRQRKPPG